ncbi:hypothetical protein RB195_009518 [Necator americanus]|uniref:Phlebovirus glycoprotein G2 fusion domain-containing protein n=1 Tax=Necator americanus TaxID=51031 RepID=A0ABR1CTN0_NECAM
MLQLHVVAEELKLISTRQNATCTVIVPDVVGCYHCLNGSRVELACHSSEHEVTAEVKCGKHHQIATSTKMGHINKLTFNFETAIVKETRTLVCPGGLTKFDISRALKHSQILLKFYAMCGGLSPDRIGQKKSINSTRNVPLNPSYVEKVKTAGSKQKKHLLRRKNTAQQQIDLDQ